MTSSSPSASPPTSSSPGELDLRGEICPFTFVRAKLALEALPIGARLRVLVDHEPASRNLPRSASAWGQEVIAVALLTVPGPASLGSGPEVLAPPVWAIDLRKRVR